MGMDGLMKKNTHREKNPDNPNDEIYMFIITQNPLNELKSIFEGKIPRGYEGGAYANEWKSGGYVPVADKPDAPTEDLVDQTKVKSAQPIPEVAVKPLTKDEFLKQIEAGKVQMKVISLPSTEKKGKNT